MTELKIFKCDVCGTRYQSEKRAKECEENHITKMKIVTCLHWKKESCEDGFPAEIIVESEDGREHTYRR